MRTTLRVGRSISFGEKMTVDLGGGLLERQFELMQRLVIAEDWGAACKRLRSVRSVRPFIARRLCRHVHPVYGSLAFQSVENSKSNEFLGCLLECGASPNQRDCSGVHILSRCMAARRSTVDSNVNLFQLLICSGGNPNAVADTTSGWPLLHWAILNGKSEFVPILLRFGADPERIVDGHDAFTLARREHHATIQAILAGWTEEYFEWMLE